MVEHQRTGMSRRGIWENNIPFIKLQNTKERAVYSPRKFSNAAYPVSRLYQSNRQMKSN